MGAMDTDTQRTKTRPSRATTGNPEHFLPHLQGLRAIAVLLVVIYHFWPGRLTGGYIGVDIFFVISGFLITGQLFRELERSGGIRLPQFYAKRARRLLPAALVVLIFCAVATLLVLPLSALSENVREIIASTFYVENWVLAFNAVDYLNAQNDPSLVQHYWSLSVEEQFYLMWPLLLLVATAVGARIIATQTQRGTRGTLAGRGPRSRPDRWSAMVWMVIIVSALSLLFSIVFTAANPSQAYFVTFTRMWEFGAGALLALLPRLRPRRAWSANVLGYAGIVTILLCAYFYDRNTPFPGYAALLPVLATAAVITAHRADRWWDAGSVLAVRPARFVGDISYSLYLWHWPLIVIAPFVPFWGLSIWNRLALLALCFVLAWLTKRFIEDPARSWRFFRERRPRTTMAYVAGAMVVTTVLAGGAYVLQQPRYEAAATELQRTQAAPPECFGAASGRTNGLGPIEPTCVNRDLQGVVIPSAGFGNADRPDHADCLVTLNDADLVSCTFGSDAENAPRIALIGDSHAYALIDPLIAIAEDRGWALTTYLKGACPWNDEPLPGSDAFTASCDSWRTKLKDELAGSSFLAVFTTALTDHDASSGELAAQADGFVSAWSWLPDPDIPIIAVVDNPVWPDDPNKCLRSSPATECTVDREDALVENSPLERAATDAQSRGARVTILNFTDTYCDELTCHSVIGGANVYRDSDHLTKTFALTLRPYFEGPLVDAVGS